MAITPAVDFESLKGSAFPVTGAIDLKGELTIGKIISNALDYIYVLAGLVLLAYLIIGGFQLMTGAADPKAQEGAKKTITNAIIGFIILFASYWLVQIIEVILGVSILK